MSNGMSLRSSSVAASTISSRSRLAAVRRAISLRSSDSWFAACSLSNRAAFSIAIAAAWQMAAAVSSSPLVNERSAPFSTSSTVPITRSLTMSGSVAQLFVSESRLISRTLAVRRGSRSEATTVGRLVSMTSRVTAASASGRYWPTHSSSTLPCSTRMIVRSPSPSTTVISHSGTPTLAHRRRAVASSVSRRSRLLESSSADSLMSVIQRTLSSSSRYRRALLIAWPATCARPRTTSSRANPPRSQL